MRRQETMTAMPPTETTAMTPRRRVRLAWRAQRGRMGRKRMMKSVRMFCDIVRGFCFSFEGIGRMNWRTHQRNGYVVGDGGVEALGIWVSILVPEGRQGLALEAVEQPQSDGNCYIQCHCCIYAVDERSLLSQPKIEEQESLLDGELHPYVEYLFSKEHLRIVSRSQIQRSQGI